METDPQGREYFHVKLIALAGLVAGILVADILRADILRADRNHSIPAKALHSPTDAAVHHKLSSPKGFPDIAMLRKVVDKAEDPGNLVVSKPPTNSNRQISTTCITSQQEKDNLQYEE